MPNMTALPVRRPCSVAVGIISNAFVFLLAASAGALADSPEDCVAISVDRSYIKYERAHAVVRVTNDCDVKVDTIGVQCAWLIAGKAAETSGNVISNVQASTRGLPLGLRLISSTR